MIGEDLVEQVAGLGLLEQIDHRVVDGVPVLVQPAGHVVGDGAGVVDAREVGVLVRL